MAVIYRSLNNGRLTLPNLSHNDSFHPKYSIYQKTDYFDDFNYLKLIPSYDTFANTNTIQLGKNNLEFILVNTNQQIVIMSFPNYFEIYNPLTYKDQFLSKNKST